MMNNELRLGDVLDSITPSDRVLVVNAAKQVVYRGYAAIYIHNMPAERH